MLLFGLILLAGCLFYGIGEGISRLLKNKI